MTPIPVFIVSLQSYYIHTSVKILNGCIILSTSVQVNTKFAAELGYLESCDKVRSFATICKQQPVVQYHDAIYCDVMITIIKEIMVQFNILII